MFFSYINLMFYKVLFMIAPCWPVAGLSVDASMTDLSVNASMTDLSVEASMTDLSVNAPVTDLSVDALMTEHDAIPISFLLQNHEERRSTVLGKASERIVC